MLQLKNETPFKPAMALFPNAEGIDTLYVMVKVTFSLEPSFDLAPAPVPVTLVDEYFGDPECSSLKQASELHLGKPGTDVILMGNAWASAGKPVPQSLVSVSVADRRVVARVVGNRRWKASGFTDPEPFESMPLIFERAYGGTHRVSDHGPLLAEERNPVGAGFRGSRSAYDMIGQALPNLEDPFQPIRSVDDRPKPVCFGFVAPSWLPRRQYAGTYDAQWQKTRAPYLPRDFNPRFFHLAMENLCFERPLSGGEPVEVVGASRSGPARFSVPSGTPRISVTVSGATESPNCQLETVLIEPDENRVCFSYRAALVCDKRVLKVEQVTIDVGTLQLPTGTGS